MNDAIDDGVDFMFSRQEADGHWQDLTGFPGGVPALCTLALLNAGVETDDPKMQLALDNLRKLTVSGELDKVYVASLFASVFAMAEPERDRLLLEQIVDWLEKRER